MGSLVELVGAGTILVCGPVIGAQPQKHRNTSEIVQTCMATDKVVGGETRCTIIGTEGLGQDVLEHREVPMQGG